MRPAEQARTRRAAALLRRAERPVRVLRTLAWPAEVAERFFACAERELPRVEYVPLDPRPVLEGVAAARRLLRGTAPAQRWLRGAARSIEAGARMLAAVGTRDFHRWSRRVYGDPLQPTVDGVTTSLDLARQLDAILADLHPLDLAPGPQVSVGAGLLARRLAQETRRRFGANAPRVEVVAGLAAKALVGGRTIRIRRGARFSDPEIQQILQHEAGVHVTTSLNGRAQDALPLLAAGHPGTTRTQEGLAVFAEFVSGSMDPARLQRLAGRVLGIQMAMEGADFLDLYRFFLERIGTPQIAFESARRVVRGGLVTGGAPFTKDGVYLDGLLRVHNFLRAVVHFERVDCLRLLFCGKLDVEDIPALAHLVEAGLCRMPRFLPPWAEDLRFLVSYLAYSSFLNRIRLDAVRSHYAGLLAGAPRVPTRRDG
jgi:uncharacterized protein (TIGR02421 family)